VPVGRERRLAYELRLTSFARAPLSLPGVEVVDDASDRVLGALTGPALDAATDIQGAPTSATTRRAVEADRRAIVYVDLPIVGAVPVTLRHRLQYEASGAADPECAALVAGRTAVDTRPLPVLRPPLRGGPWVAVYDPHLERGCRRVVYAVGGRATIPGRHAVDWMRPSTAGVGKAGKDTTRGGGAEVLAVADGVIASTCDGVPEPTPGAERPRVGLADATGNYISVDIGNARYAFYRHLMPGLLVKPGERVRRGQVIARLGSTGQASRPHLHFHVADANRR
jgi:murein DD-endopeptidase MepM/ murein hydrolase activator NlpD